MKNMKNTFLQVDYDLLSSTELHSTQKLFIAYIIGWQRNKKICRETNKNLANKFGMKYSGIRTLIRTLNKYDFFQSTSFDYNESINTSGHELKVDESKLKCFLGLNKKSNAKIVDDSSANNITKIVHIEESEDEISMYSTTSEVPIVIHDKNVSDENHDIIIYANEDITSNTTIIEEYFLANGANQQYIKAKVIFDSDDDYVFGNVFEVRDSKNKRRYIDEGTFQSFIKNYQPKEVE